MSSSLTIPQLPAQASRPAPTLAGSIALCAVSLRTHAHAVLLMIAAVRQSSPLASHRSTIRHAADVILHLGTDAPASGRHALARALDALGRVIARLMIDADAGMIAAGDATALIVEADRLALRIAAAARRTEWGAASARFGP